MQRETIVRFIEKRSDVPIERRIDKRFQKEVNDLVRLFWKWDMLEAIAIHEAGHETYFRKAGFTTFRYDPSTVVYRQANKDQPFESQVARIIPENYPTEPIGDWQLHLAMGYAAGGECARRLTTIDYGGDTIDRKLFKQMCDSWYDGADADQFMDVEEKWTTAQTTIREELNKSVLLRMQVKSRANEIIPQLFPWMKYA